ncbi:MAG: hypothetical protein KBS81_09540 [Spirochaetales bacterium]|nr:hypothetical protein [Candidatus Physcosoma equi]
MAEAKEVFSLHKDVVGIIHPGLNMLLHPRDWAKEMAKLSFVIICGGKEEPEIQRLKKELENEIYSPMRKTLSGVAIASSPEEASLIFDSLSLEKKGTITVNSTEGEL